VDTTTIQKCFAKAGFTCNSDAGENCEEIQAAVTSSDESEDDDVPLLVIKMAKDLFGCEFKDLVEIDQSVQTCEEVNWDLPASQLITQNIHNSDTDSDVEEEEVSGSACSISDVQEYLGKLKQFAQITSTTDLLSNIMNASDIVNKMSITVVKQKAITDFFKKVYVHCTECMSLNRFI
jgi:hypothetical protein